MRLGGKRTSWLDIRISSVYTVIIYWRGENMRKSVHQQVEEAPASCLNCFVTLTALAAVPLIALWIVARLHGISPMLVLS